jgi:hypothetical protein
MSPLENNRRKVPPTEFPSHEEYRRQTGRKLSPEEYERSRLLHARSRGLEPWPPKEKPTSRGLNRRQFLVGVGSIAAVGLGYAAYEMLRKYPALEGVVGGGDLDQFDYDDVVKQAKAFLKERYGGDVTLVVGDDKDLYPEITGEKVTLDKYKVSIRAIVGELSRDPEYPVEFIRAIAEGRGVEFRVMHNVHLEETDGDNPFLSKKDPVGGVAPRLREGKPAQIIIDSDESEEFQRQTVHHEINHRAAAKWQNREDRDGKWRGLHAGAMSNPYKRKPKGGHDYSVPPPRYFLNHHASTHPVEDQAVTAEYMLTPRLHVQFAEKVKIERDPAIKAILIAKYNRVKAEYAEWSKGKIDEAFWDKIIKQGLKEKGTLVG